MKIPKPYRLMLELTRRCNASCIMCTRPSVVPKKDMSVEVAKRYIDEAYTLGAREFDPRWFGEITCYPREKLKAVCNHIWNKAGTKIMFYTNGSGLDEDLAEFIVARRNRILRIVFSIDECEKERYERIRVGLDFDRVIKNLEYLHSINRGKDRKIHLCIRACAMKENRGRIGKMKEFFADKCEHFWSSPEVPRKQNANRVPVKGGFMCGDDVLGVMVIAADGTMPMCCTDWHLTNSMGNASDGLKTTWYGEKHLDLINSRPELEMCRNCR